MTQGPYELTSRRELLRPIKRAGGHTTPLIERRSQSSPRHPLERAAHDHALPAKRLRCQRPAVERRGQRAVLHASHDAGHDTALPLALDRVHAPPDEHRAHVALDPSEHEALSLANARKPTLMLGGRLRLSRIDHVAPGFKRRRGAGTRDAPHRPRQHLPLARVLQKTT